MSSGAAAAAAVELPAPPGWRKKFMPKKSATPGPRMGNVVFISPAGEEIKSKAQLDRYLKAHPGGLSSSDFDWSTGEVPRRSARLGQKVKASETPEDEPPAKRARKSRPAKAKVVEMKQDSDIEMEDASATDKDEALIEVLAAKEECLPQNTEDTEEDKAVDRSVEPMSKAEDAKCEDGDKNVAPAAEGEANKKSAEEAPKDKPEAKGLKTIVVAETKVEEAKEPETNFVAETKMEEEKGPETNVVTEMVEEAKCPESNVVAESKGKKGPKTNVVIEMKVEEAKGPETNVVAESNEKGPQTNVVAESNEKGPQTNVVPETKVEEDVDKPGKYIEDNAKVHLQSIHKNGHEDIKGLAVEEGVEENKSAEDSHPKAPNCDIGKADEDPSSVLVAPAGGASLKTDQRPGEIPSANAEPHENCQKSGPKVVPPSL